jgi:hypothetical protein
MPTLFVPGNTLAGNGYCQTMKHAIELVTVVEKIFPVSEVISQLLKVSQAVIVIWVDIIRKSFVERFANFVVRLRIDETPHHRLRFVRSDVRNAASCNRW